MRVVRSSQLSIRMQLRLQKVAGYLRGVTAYRARAVRADDSAHCGWPADRSPRHAAGPLSEDSGAAGREGRQLRTDALESETLSAVCGALRHAQAGRMIEQFGTIFAGRPPAAVLVQKSAPSPSVVT